MTPEQFNALVGHIMQETGLDEPAAGAAAAIGTSHPTDPEGRLLIASGGRTYPIKPWL